MAAPLLLGIDLGTSSLKAVLVTLDGQTVATAGAEYPILRPQPGHAEQDPWAWWAAAGDAARRALSAAPAGFTVAAVGLSGQMHGVVMTDADGAPLAPAIIWPDQRSAAQVAAITAELGARALVRLSGSPLATGFMAATLRWLAENLPGLVARATWCLAPKDWLRLQMVGAAATDPSDAAGALLLETQQRTWAPALLAAAHADPAKLPPLLPSAHVAGGLLPRAAAHLGLAAGTPVVVGAADAACALLGAGAVNGRTLVVNLSTGGQLVLPAATPTVDDQGRLHTFASALEPDEGEAARAGWYIMGATLNVGLAMRWLRDSVLGLTGDDAYTRMTELAAQEPIGARGLLFLPYLAGERTPLLDPLARAAFLGLTAGHGQGALVRAVMEGATFACRAAYDALLQVSPPPARVLLAGGGARSPLWQQMVADILGVAVQRLLVQEQSATGAALLAGEGAGLFAAHEAAALWAQVGPPVLPNPAAQEQYARVHTLWHDAWARNRDLFHTLHTLAAAA